MSDTVDCLLDLTQAGKLAGHCFWSWQDLRQYTRIDHEMRNGVLESGVVTEGREPRDSIYMELERLFDERRREDDKPSLRPELLPLRRVTWSQESTFTQIPIDSLVASANGLRAWATFEANLAKYWASLRFSVDQWARTDQKFQLWTQDGHDLMISGVPFSIPSIEGHARPLIVSKLSAVTIPIGRTCSRIHILGHAEFLDDFLFMEHIGQVLGTLTLNFSSGQTKAIPLRSGYEIARANQIYDATRIEIVVLEAQPAIRYQKDFAREDYQFLLYSTSQLPKEPLTRVTYEVHGEHSSLAVLGMTVED